MFDIEVFSLLLVETLRIVVHQVDRVEVQAEAFDANLTTVCVASEAQVDAGFLGKRKRTRPMCQEDFERVGLETAE